VRFPAFFDTNVLYGAILNDLVLEMADRGLFRPLWSADVMEELRRNLSRRAEKPELVDKRINTMVAYFPDAMVTGYEILIDSMTNDSKDRHVLAAAVSGGAEVIVTFNTRDFPDSSVQPFDIEVVHPDDFLLDQLDLHHGATLNSFRELVINYNSPAMTEDDLLLALTRAGVARFAEAVREAL